MNQRRLKNETVQKITLIGILTALTAVLSYIKIPVVSTATVTLVLPVVVIGAIICGPLVGAWLTVIPTLTSFGEAALFLSYSPFGTMLTLFLKGLLAGYLSGVVYKLLSKKNSKGAVISAAIVAPVVNTGVFVLGCYIFIWDKLIALAVENEVGIGMLLFGLAGMNFIIELVINIVLCPAIMRIIRIADKKNLLFKNGKNIPDESVKSEESIPQTEAEEQQAYEILEDNETTDETEKSEEE